MAICLVGTQWGYYLGTQMRRFYKGPLVVCGRDPQRTRQIAGRLGAKWIVGYEEAFSSPEITAVILAVPAPLHLELGLAAIRRNKHVLIEKPLSLDLHGSDALIAAARQEEIVLSVGENIPYRPAIRTARRLLPHIGERRLFFASSLRGAARSGAETGILIDFSVHHIRALRELFGEPDKVYAASAPAKEGGPSAGDNITLLLSSESGGWRATLASSWQASAGICPEFIVSGTRGAIKIWPDRFSVDLYPVEPGLLTKLISRVRPSWLQQLLHSPEWPRRRFLFSPWDRMGYQSELRDFLRAVQRGLPDVSSALEARRDLEVAIAAEESLRSGHAVPCELEDQLQAA